MRIICKYSGYRLLILTDFKPFDFLILWMILLKLCETRAGGWGRGSGAVRQLDKMVKRIVAFRALPNAAAARALRVSSNRLLSTPLG